MSLGEFSDILEIVDLFQKLPLFHLVWFTRCSCLLRFFLRGPLCESKIAFGNFSPTVPVTRHSWMNHHKNPTPRSLRETILEQIFSFMFPSTLRMHMFRSSALNLLPILLTFISYSHAFANIPSQTCDRWAIHSDVAYCNASNPFLLEARNWTECRWPCEECVGLSRDPFSFGFLLPVEEDSSYFWDLRKCVDLRRDESAPFCPILIVVDLQDTEFVAPSQSFRKRRVDIQTKEFEVFAGPDGTDIVLAQTNCADSRRSEEDENMQSTSSGILESIVVSSFCLMAAIAV